eukprot:GHRR01031700.1.p2 GENE.GHRR01031700.1~~GHRR01031700.1.p2  ORF type:complete len:103 (-),score=19.83 GHRR01031700.1:62-370(-)
MYSTFSLRQYSMGLWRSLLDTRRPSAVTAKPSPARLFLFLNCRASYGVAVDCARFRALALPPPALPSLSPPCPAAAAAVAATVLMMKSGDGASGWTNALSKC